MSAPVDVLAVMGGMIRAEESAARAAKVPAGKVNHRAETAEQLREARAAVAELINAANKVNTQVAPLLESNGYIHVGAMDALRRALARIGGAP